MGIVYPRGNTAWRKLTDRIRAEWNQHGEQAIGEALVDYAAETYFQPIDKDMRYRLQFRMRTIMQVICVEQHLKPHLRALPWEEAIMLPESFHYDNCDNWSELENVIRSMTKA